MDRLASLVRQEAALELARKAELLRVLGALANRGFQPLILKGGALAYSLYSAPFLRPRGDTDLLISDSVRAAAFEVLEGMGYVHRNQISGSLVSTQAGFQRTDASGIVYVLDVHWRSHNSPLLSGVLDYTAELVGAVSIPALGVHAFGLRPVAALLFACAHRSGHMLAPFYVGEEAHFGGDRLIWLYDIHLLSQSLQLAGWQAFEQEARRHRIQAIAHDGLRATVAAFNSQMPGHVLEALGSTKEPEPSSVLLRGSRLAVMREEFGVLPSWRHRLLFLREHLLPDTDYILRKYGRQSRLWLPWLYFRRALEGLAKLRPG